MLLTLCTLIVGSHGTPALYQHPGDVAVCYEICMSDLISTNIGAQRIGIDGRLVWGTAEKGTDVASSDAIEAEPSACDDGEGGMIVAYEYVAKTGEHAGDADIVVQRISREGKVLWAAPKPVASSKGTERHPIAISDGAGGAIVVYEWFHSKGDTDILAQRIGPDGTCLWNGGAKPAVLLASDHAERNACAVSDGRGGAIVFCEWEGADGDVDIMASHVTADGGLPWDKGNKALDVAASDPIERHPRAVADGAGGAFVVFESEPRSGDNQGDRDIAAQHLSADGHLLWSTDGKPATVASAPGKETNPVAVPDGAGGIIVAYRYEPVSGEHKGDTDIYAQRLDAQGKMAWNEGKRSVPVCTSKRLERAPAIAQDGAGGAIVVCESEIVEGERKGDIDLLAQRIDANGKPLWNGGGSSKSVASSNWLETEPIAVADGSGGVIVVFTAQCLDGEFAGDYDVSAARLSADGDLLWLEGKRAVDLARSKEREWSPCVVVIGAR